MDYIFATGLDIYLYQIYCNLDRLLMMVMTMWLFLSRDILFHDTSVFSKPYQQHHCCYKHPVTVTEWQGHGAEIFGICINSEEWVEDNHPNVTRWSCMMPFSYLKGLAARFWHQYWGVVSRRISVLQNFAPDQVRTAIKVQSIFLAPKIVHEYLFASKIML